VSATPAGRLLVVAPHATRTGSTRVLLDLLQRAAPDLPPLAVELESGGPFEEQLRALGGPLQPGERPVAVLVNSSLAAGRLVDLEPGVPAAVYVHESLEVLEELPAPAAQGVRRADLVLCVSDRSAGELAAFGVDPARVRVVPPLVADAPAPGGAAAAVRAGLGLAVGDRLVLGCGEASDRKGTDLFVELAVRLRGEPHLRLAWVGRRLRATARRLDHDVDAAGLEDLVTWVDEVDDPVAHLAAADVLVMTSRTDPQPLVPLEAALQGTPTVAFAVDGLGDLGAAGAAATVPYPDTVALAAAVRRLLADPAAGEALVAAAVERRDRDQSAARVVPRFLAAMGALLGGAPGGPATE
jgi:glycosyltransferase involved in cell wall biosynthesis